jgi:hypothetical protein
VRCGLAREDVEDSFWLGLLGPAGYLLSNRSRRIEKAILAGGEPSGEPQNATFTGVGAETDSAEIAITSAVARLRDAQTVYDALGPRARQADLDSAEEAEAAVARDVRPGLDAARDWACRLEGPEPMRWVLYWLREATDEWATAAAQAEDAWAVLAHDHLRRGDEAWSQFQNEASLLARQSRSRR